MNDTDVATPILGAGASLVNKHLRAIWVRQRDALDAAAAAARKIDRTIPTPAVEYAVAAYIDAMRAFPDETTA